MIAWRAALALTLLTGCGTAAMAQTRGALDGAAVRDGVAKYRRCIAVRAILTPNVLADRQERAVGAVLDCLHHHGDTLATVTSAPRPVPRLLRTRRAQTVLSHAATVLRRWSKGATR